MSDGPAKLTLARAVEHLLWKRAGFAINSPRKKRDLLKRYGIALTLAALALLITLALRDRIGGAFYQLSFAAVILSAFFSGRGPGLFALLISATGILYWLVPPVNSFDIAPGDLLAFVTFIGLCVLLTEFGEARLRIGRALQDNETRFRTFVDSATDGFFLLDQHLRVVDVNQQACESMGRSREEFIGTHPRQFAMGLDEPAAEQLCKRARAGKIITYETQHRRETGTWFPVEIRIRMFEKGADLFYLWIVRDISERKQAEERKAKLAAIVESSDDAIISKDLNGIITTWNAGAERIFGYAAREIIDQSVTVLAAPDRVDEAAGILERIRCGEKVDHFETVRRRKDGTLLEISLTVSPIIDESGNVVGASKIARDISGRKRAEIALRQRDDALEMTRTELARMSRVTALGELTTSIAHEVAQPLGGMIASAGAGLRWLSAERPNIAEARAAFDNIVSDGKRAREVIARIRAYTKRQVPRREKLDVNQQILEVLALTDRELRGHEIVLRTQLDRTLPGVAGDRIQLQQVLVNLTMNAIEAMSGIRDRPRELTVVSAQDGTKAVRIEVRDSGTGLDSQGAERVFEAFYSTKAEGIGIGLSISRSIVEAHGGRLWARPNEPQGAVFGFSLPVWEEALS
jgi:PAS domain S-box-containing protein